MFHVCRRRFRLLMGSSKCAAYPIMLRPHAYQLSEASLKIVVQQEFIPLDSVRRTDAQHHGQIQEKQTNAIRYKVRATL